MTYHISVETSDCCCSSDEPWQSGLAKMARRTLSVSCVRLRRQQLIIIISHEVETDWVSLAWERVHALSILWRRTSMVAAKFVRGSCHLAKYRFSQKWAEEEHIERQCVKKENIHAYRCPECLKWHIGHSSRNDNKKWEVLVWILKRRWRSGSWLFIGSVVILIWCCIPF